MLRVRSATPVVGVAAVRSGELLMRPRRLWSTVVLVVCIAVAAAVGAGLAAGTETATHSRTVEGTGLFSLSQPLTHATDRTRYSLVIVGAVDATRAAKEPGRSLVYFSGTDVNTDWSTGVPYPQARARGWLLKDAGGNLLRNEGFPDNYIGDVGNPDYQQVWAANVLRFLKQHHDDGIYIDDVLRDLSPIVQSAPAKYPTQQSWAAAELSFIKAVGSALHSHGYYVLVNAPGYTPGDHQSDDGGNTISWWRQLGPYVNGLLYEYFQQSPTGDSALRPDGAAWNQHWSGWQRLVQAAQSMKRDFVGVTYGPPDDLAQLMYGKASFLLDWNGGGGAFVYMPTDGTHPTSAVSVWRMSIGTPTSPKRRVGAGWLRKYQQGIALVNPSQSASQRFNLGGRYTTPDKTVVTSVTLRPTSALILRTAAPAH